MIIGYVFPMKQWQFVQQGTQQRNIIATVLQHVVRCFVFALLVEASGNNQTQLI